MTVPVSVVIPCKNGEKFLGETLQSAVAQEPAPLEVIVVDDGSTDRTAEIAKSFAPLVRVCANAGRGVSAARTYGFAQSRGEFIQFLDADDLLLPGTLARRVAALNASSADIALCGWQYLKPSGSGWTEGACATGDLPAGDEPADVKVFRGFWAPPAAVLYRRALVERIGPWSATLPVIQDARYLFDAFRVGGRAVHVPGLGAQYRQHAAGSVSTRSSSAFWWDVLRNGLEVEALWTAESPLSDTRREALGDLYVGCARMGFTTDRELFEAAVREADRFPESRVPRLVQAARRLTPTLGYDLARWVLCGRGSAPGAARSWLAR